MISLTTLLRLFIYTALMSVVLCVVIFIKNTNEVTKQSLKVLRAYQDIFEPVAFKAIQPFLMYQAQQRVLTSYPRGLAEIISVESDGEMTFVVTYNVIEVDGLRDQRQDFIRINWKPYLYD